MHSVRNRSHSPHASEGESVAEAARVLIDSIRFDSTGNPRITDEVRLSKCSLLLKRAPSARAAVLEVITRCIERNVMHLPVFKTNINDIRRDHYNKGMYNCNDVVFNDRQPCESHNKSKSVMSSSGNLMKKSNSYN